MAKPAVKESKSPMKQKANYFTDNEDLLFHFKNTIPWKEFVPLLEKGFTDKDGFGSFEEAMEVYEQALTMVGQYCGTEISARAAAIDEEGLRYKDGEVLLSEPMRQNLAGLKELGVMALSLPREHGGSGFPATVSAVALEMLSRACVSTMIEYAFYAAPARMIWRFGNQGLKREWLPRICSGEISGAIAITEPEAGSDVGNLRTSASLRDGTWHINGRKQFITNASGEAVVVLARTDPHSKWLKGLSVFLVPKTIRKDGQTLRNMRIAPPEKKLCIKGSPTCELFFEDSIGYLLGEEGKGFEHVLYFMNEGRIGVGIQSLGLAQAAYNKAYEYAQQRVQMGKPIARHELVAEMLLDMETDIKGLRSLIYETIVIADTMEGLERKLERLEKDGAEYRATKAEIEKLWLQLRERTPLIKYYGAEKCMEITRKAVQVHGGYGVMNDYEVERFYRDAVIFPIYEGTSQIQSLMAMKDRLKDVYRCPSTFFKNLVGSLLRCLFNMDRLKRKLAEAEWHLYSSVAYMLFSVVKEKLAAGKRKPDRADAEGDPSPDGAAYAKLNAERLASILAMVHISRILLKQAHYSEERRGLAERFIYKMCPQVALHARYIKSGDTSTLEYIERMRAI